MNYIKTNGQRLGIDTSDGSEFGKRVGVIRGVSFAEVENAQTRYLNACALVDHRETKTPATVHDKQVAYKEYKTLVRIFIREKVRNNPYVTDADLINMGMMVYKTEKTPPIVETTHPEVDAYTPQPGTLEFHVHLENQKKAVRIADGQKGVELRYAVGETPVMNWDQLPNSRLETKARFRISFESEKRGNFFSYAIRWVNKRDEAGPWSNIQNIIIP
jgi:hypothetical protein